MIEKSKIAVVTCDFPPLSTANSVRIKSIVDAFLKNNYRVTVYTSNISKHNKEYNVVSNFFAKPSNKSKYLKRLIEEIFFSFETCIRILLSNNKLIFVSSPPFILAIFVSFISFLKNTKLILDIRDEYPSIYFIAGIINKHSLLGKLLISLEKWLYQRAYLISTVSTTILEKIRDSSSKTTRAYLVRNGFDDDIFFPNIQKYIKFTVVFHGTLGRFQDIDLLIKLAKKFDETKMPIVLLVLGSGPKEFSIKRVNAKSIKYQGWLNQSDLAAIISKAHLGVSFRSDEPISRASFPVKIYEYIGVGIPVIVTPISEAGKFIQKNEIGYQFQPDQVYEIFSKIVYLYKNKKKYKQLCNNVKRLRNKFTRSRISDDFIKLVVHGIE